MKVDKDAILKQKFWLLLGAFVVLWLISLSALYASGSGPADEAKKNFEAAKTTITHFTGDKRPKNDSFLGPWKQYGERFDTHKKTVWHTAWFGDKPDDSLPPGQKRWEGQWAMYTWPSSAEYPLQTELLYPDSPKADGSGPVFDVTRREWYKGGEAYGRQFEQLKTELKGEGDNADLDKPLGAVDFKGGFNGVMQPIDWTQGGKLQRPPDVEECWLAQEDFWVKRELLYTVRDALSMIAAMDPADADFEKTPLPEGKLARHVFRNTSWEVQLLFDKGANGIRISPDSTVKNIHVSHRDQTLGTARNPAGVYFRLRQRDGATIRPFAVVGEKVAWQQSRRFGDDAKAKDGFVIGDVDPKQPMGLEQVFDPTNVPIAVVDEIKIPYLSDRNANRPLVPTKPDRYGKHEAAADAAKAPGAPGTTAAPAPGMAPPPVGGPPGIGAPPGGSGGPGQSGAAATANKTVNGFFDRNRYLFVTEQSRHLPLALTVTIDQSHLGEILVAVANSRLRFQTTQVEFRRVHDAGSGATPAPGGFMPPGGSTGPGAMPTPPPLTPMGPIGPGGAAAAPPPADVGNPNLIEATIYGIASLYERPRDQ